MFSDRRNLRLRYLEGTYLDYPLYSGGYLPTWRVPTIPYCTLYPIYPTLFYTHSQRSALAVQTYQITSQFLSKEWIMLKWDAGYYITAVAGTLGLCPAPSFWGRRTCSQPLDCAGTT